MKYYLTFLLVFGTCYQLSAQQAADQFTKFERALKKYQRHHKNAAAPQDFENYELKWFLVSHTPNRQWPDEYHDTSGVNLL